VLLTLAQATAGLAMLFFGGEFLLRGAAGLATRLGISQLAIGLTVVAFGTSAPEMVVSLDAAMAGANDISVGNVVGSNIANIALILGLAAMLKPATVEAKIVRIDAPIMIVVSLALVGALADGTVSRREGAILALSLLGYLVFTFWEARRESRAVREELATAAPEPPSGPLTGTLLAVSGLALLVGGGHLLVDSAITLATLFGISQAVIGLTIVAVGTSLPELATSVIASLRGQGDIAAGNVVGSNIFNILGIMGLTALVHPLASGGITRVDLATMVGLAAIVTVLLSAQRCIGRAAGGFLLAAYAGYTAWLLLS
jgi:cation:H+ antiporter